jgi:hypothetical protein
MNYRYLFRKKLEIKKIRLKLKNKVRNWNYDLKDCISNLTLAMRAEKMKRRL